MDLVWELEIYTPIFSGKKKNVGLFLGKHESEDWISFSKLDHGRYIVWNCLLLIPLLTHFNGNVSGVEIILGITKETDTYLLE